MNISRETRLEDLLERYPAARVVLSRYGLDSYEEADSPRESVAQFAEDRSIPAERLLEELGRVVDISLQEPPPTSFLSLLETHEWLDEHFLLHQEALLAGGSPSGARAPEDGRGRPEGAHKGGRRASLARLRTGRAHSGW